MDLSQTPVFDELPPAERAALLDAGERRSVAAGDVLCYEGDAAGTLYVVVSGRLTLTYGDDARDAALHGDLLDPVAVLGGLPHTLKATVTEDGEVLCWPADAVMQSPEFAEAARRYLAASLRAAQARLDTADARINYVGPSALLLPGPYLFENVTMIFAFCEANLDEIRGTLPPGLSLLRVPGLRRGVMLLALTDFPVAYPLARPDAPMAPYTETTIFIPVRYRAAFGLYVPFIYPSAWEPTLLGREIYGFPKRIGITTLAQRSATLAVDGQMYLQLDWEQTEPGSEPALVGALMDLLGVQRHVGELAFRAGEIIRKTMRLPAYRRVDVYNHKRVLAASATTETPTYAVDCLTRATFGVLRWYQIAKARAPALTVGGGPLASAGLTLRAVFRAQLDMRLSTGRVVRDYRAPEPPAPDDEPDVTNGEQNAPNAHQI